MPKLIRDAAIATALLFSTAACATPAATNPGIETTSNVTAETVSSVVFENGGRLAVSGDKEWTEYSNGDGQPVGKFSEASRGEWSVVLEDEYSNKRLYIDLRKNILSYDYDEGPVTFLYNLESASEEVPTPLSKYVSANVDATNLIQATYKEGDARFENSEGDIWLEYDAAGKAIYAFKETSRDTTSVYLLDAGRNVQIQLDVEDKTILLTTDNPADAEEWPMIEAMRTRDNLTD